MLYISELCELCAIAYEIYKRNLHCVNHIPGIHDNGPRDHELWRRTLTAYLETLFISSYPHWLLFAVAQYCIRHIFRVQIFSRFWTRLGNLLGINFANLWCFHYYEQSMGGGTFGLHNGLGGQSIVHTQWVPPPPQHHCQHHLNVLPPMEQS